MGACELERFLDDLDALALQHIGKARVVLEMAMIEFCDQLLLATVPIVEERRNDSERLDPAVKPDAVVELERGGMIGARARHLLQEVVCAECLDQDNPDTLL